MNNTKWFPHEFVLVSPTSLHHQFILLSIFQIISKHDGFELARPFFIPISRYHMTLCGRLHLDTNIPYRDGMDGFGQILLSCDGYTPVPQNNTSVCTSSFRGFQKR